MSERKIVARGITANDYGKSLTLGVRMSDFLFFAFTGFAGLSLALILLGEMLQAPGFQLAGGALGFVAIGAGVLLVLAMILDMRKGVRHNGKH